MRANYLWAKKSDKSGHYEWLSLNQHLEDARGVAGYVWNNWLSPGQKQLILNSMHSLDEEDGEAILMFLAAIHDLGKATPAFQKQVGYSNSPDLDLLLIERLEQLAFPGLIDKNLPNARETHHSLAGQYILTSFGVNEDIASIIGGHHGKPVEDINYRDNQAGYLSNYYQEESAFLSVDKIWRDVQQQILNYYLDCCGFASIEDLPRISQPGQVILSALVIMIDWIVSNEHYFPLVDLNTVQVKNQEERVKKGWKYWFKTYPLTPNYFPEVESLYKKRFNFLPREPQRVLAEVIDKPQRPGIFIFEAPMGMGKTEAALIGAEQLAFRMGKSGIFFGLPTQATSNSMFSRINMWLETIKSEFSEKISIQLVHGKSALNQEFASLARSVDINDPEGTVIVNQWFSGRKTSMLDDFVVGTVDHVLLAALKQKHLALRHLGLSKKVVIIDEVHAYDAYMSSYLERALEWLAAYNVPVILLSATLPAQTRENLARAYLKGKGLNKYIIDVPKGGLSTSAYPLVTYTDGNKILQESNFAKQDDKAVEVVEIDDENLLDQLAASLENGAVAGIILNTVKRAQALAAKCSEIFGPDHVFLLHSSFIATERIVKEKELMGMIGKGAARPKGKIIIGTQVMEQSLDIDFDVLFTDLAPMDLLIQRVGRLHRHHNLRPKNHERPRLYVLGTNKELEFESGSKYVYGDYLLARTQYYLPEIINLPSDISPLVQKVYSKEELILPEEHAARYLVMQNNFINERNKKKARAGDYLLASPELEDGHGGEFSLIGWLSNLHLKQTEEYGYAQVRDAQETIEVIALKKQGQGYGFFESSIDISSELDNNEVARKIAQATLRLPLALSMYGRAGETINKLEIYNQNHLPEWQQQEWLKGSLGIIFDENNEFHLGKYILNYDSKYGLTFREED